MFQTKKGKSQEWAEWFSKVKAKRQEVRGLVGLGAAQAEHEMADNGLAYLTEKIGSSLPIANRLPNPISRQHDEVIDYLNQQLAALDQAVRARRNIDADRREQYRIWLKELREAKQRLQAASASLAEMQEWKDQLGDELQALEDEAPKASNAVLTAMAQEMDEAGAEKRRIQTAIDTIGAHDGALEKARKAASEAEDRVAEAEALAAMGEASPEEVKAANAASAKARTQAEKQHAELRRAEAARRGLARKLESAASLAEEVQEVYHQALIHVRTEELADREAKLVSRLMAVREDLADMERIYSDLEDAQPGTSYGPARVEVKLPHLHQHPEHELLNSWPLELSGAGAGAEG